MNTYLPWLSQLMAINSLSLVSNAGVIQFANFVDWENLNDEAPTKMKNNEENTKLALIRTKNGVELSADFKRDEAKPFFILKINSLLHCTLLMHSINIFQDNWLIMQSIYCTFARIFALFGLFEFKLKISSPLKTRKMCFSTKISWLSTRNSTIFQKATRKSSPEKVPAGIWAPQKIPRIMRKTIVLTRDISVYVKSALSRDASKLTLFWFKTANFYCRQLSWCLLAVYRDQEAIFARFGPEEMWNID